MIVDNKIIIEKKKEPVKMMEYQGVEYRKDFG